MTERKSPAERATMVGVTGQRGESGVSGLSAALERVGDRWSLLLVEALLEGEARFNDLAAAVPGIAPNILTDRLRRLERAGVIVGQRYSERPVRLAYSLTQEGLELAGVLRLLAAWGSSGGGEASEGLRHIACGSPLEARWYCPTCAAVVSEGDASALRYA
jgi:DNA-binding HxlR family transcriptional regulator